MTYAVVLWELPSGQVLEIDNYCRCLAFSSDSRFLATGERGSINVWDIASEKRPKRSFNLHFSYYSDNAFDLVFAPDGRTLLCKEYGYETGKFKIKLWDIPSKNERQTLIDLDLSCFALSPDGYILASAGGNGTTIKLWRLL